MHAVRFPALHNLFLGLFFLTTIGLAGCSSSTPFANLSARALRDAAQERAKGNGAEAKDIQPTGLTRLPEGAAALSPTSPQLAAASVTPKGAKIRTQKSETPATDAPETVTRTFVDRASLLRRQAAVQSQPAPTTPLAIKDGDRFPVLFLGQSQSAAAYLAGEKGQLVIQNGTKYVGRRFTKAVRAEDGRVLSKAVSYSNSSIEFGPAQSEAPYLRYFACPFQANAGKTETFAALAYDANEKPDQKDKVSAEDFTHHRKWTAYMMEPQFKSFKGMASLTVAESDDPQIALTGYGKWSLKNPGKLEVYKSSIGKYPVLVGFVPKTKTRPQRWFIALPANPSSPSQIVAGR